ncbi:DTW domain-containing protein [uncultured Umboniibacter sp.]|uniref:DTW domain-containing protein n=1 Tax=uncultured Umboniibacter sp. TaxID=1798917 RepID=UPI0026025DA2|nr:DTW domain-containing protein [uncultured Umboniibacter sp.]
MAGVLVDRAGLPRCRRCNLREVACFCRSIRSLHLPFEVHLLAHPLELKRPSSSVLFLQLDSQVKLHTYQRTQLLTPEIGDVLLYPKTNDPLPVDTDTNPSKDTNIRRLWLLDGTWQETTKMLANQPLLARLPRLSIACRSSRYPFRKNQRMGGLSTAEALLASVDDSYSQHRESYYDEYLAHAVASMNGHAPC